MNPTINLFNIDCNEYMKNCNDNQFDLAIIDPPYGINRSGQKETFTKQSKHKRKYYEDKKWDENIPDKSYFDQIFRISKNQIIFGANYFTKFLPGSKGWVFWDKGQNLTMSDGELIFTSFDRALRRVIINRNQIQLDGAIHPTQKPVKLYKWILTHYAQPGNKIFDSHLGSGSIAIACNDYGFDLTACEIDKEYFKKAVEWLELKQLQYKIF